MTINAQPVQAFFGLLLVLNLAAAVAACGPDSPQNSSTGQPASTLLDLSGLAWLGGNTFVAVHDSKNPVELERPRVSILTAPVGAEGLLWREASLNWPDPLGPSNDLESASVLPGTSDVLFAESGDDALQDPAYQRLFLAHFDGHDLTIVNHTTWPVPAYNVEAHAVGAIEGGFVFAYAERAQGEGETHINWARFDPDSLSFGPFSSVRFPNPDPAANRPVVAMEFDASGALYTAAAFDPDADTGPFSSTVWKIGNLESHSGEAQVVLADPPELLATLDGLKVESVVVNDLGEVYIGTDDEDLGNVLRPLP